MKIRPLENWIKNGVKGIFVWGCVKRGEGSSFRAKAHSHNFRKDTFCGWICFRSTKRLADCFVLYAGEIDGFNAQQIGTNRILLHEYAHILTPNHTHDDAWRRKMKELGQPISKQYIKTIKTRRR